MATPVQDARRFLTTMRPDVRNAGEEEVRTLPVHNAPFASVFS